MPQSLSKVRKMSSQDEFRKFLERYKVADDERYV